MTVISPPLINEGSNDYALRIPNSFLLTNYTPRTDGFASLNLNFLGRRRGVGHTCFTMPGTGLQEATRD